MPKENEQDRQQMFNSVMEVVHNCIWSNDDDYECDKGLFVHIHDVGAARSLRVYKFNMDNKESFEVLKTIAISVTESEALARKYN